MTTVLIDGDILIYEIASTEETATEFPEETWVLWADLPPARARMNRAIDAIVEKTGASDYEICLTASNNFRLGVDDSYKHNRAGVRKPMLIPRLREHALEHHGAQRWNRLEGDDIIGILATGKHRDDHVIYSADKDLKTIPGTHWSEDMEMAFEVSEDDAYHFFLAQVMAGDPTDGYAGIPGVGMKTAEKALTEMKGWVLNTDKGTWKRFPMDDPWDVVVSYYEKAGLCDTDAIVTARLAYILQDKDYEKGKVKLWTPQDRRRPATEN